MTNRREFLKTTAAAMASISLPAKAAPSTMARQDPLRLIIIGGGVAGTQLARLLQHEPGIQTTIFEQSTRSDFLNPDAVLGSERGIIASPHAMRTVHHRVVAVDPVGQYVMDETGTLHGYDRLAMATGISLDTSAYEQVDTGIPSAWARGPESAQLGRRLRAMPEGGVVTITVPKRPYRYTEGPYLRALRIARWLETNRPGSKVLLLDENPEDASSDDLMQSVETLVQGLKSVEWARGITIQRAIHQGTGYEILVGGEVIQADVLNFIPRQRASELALRSGLASGDWCPRDPDSLESTLIPGIHILGDSALETTPHQKRADNAQRDALHLARDLIAFNT